VSRPINVNPASWGSDEAGALNGASGEGLASLLIDLVDQQPGVKTICDLGCGNGYLAGRLGERGYQVLGIDGSRPYIETARRLHTSPSLRFQEALFGDSLIASLAGERFDLVISSDVIEHLYHPRELIRTAHGIVKPGGRLIVGTPYHGYLKNVAIAVMGKWDAHHSVHWDGGHIKFFSVPTLRAMVEGCGFTDPRFAYYGRFQWLAKNMICIARRDA
jgi:SAM-dependent methyltransferase